MAVLDTRFFRYGPAKAKLLSHKVERAVLLRDEASASFEAEENSKENRKGKKRKKKIKLIDPVR
jgi:hypothetical protein